DYCCCHASFALQEMGVESIMVNCNPETVSTDYDTSDRLYFEPLTLENVLNIVDIEKPDGVIVQFGGQTPLNLALPLKRLGVPIIGTDPSDIDLAEDRKLFGKLLDDLGIPCPENGTATKVEVDALGDGDEVLIAGIMEHIEEAGVHSGDSSCVLPPQSLSAATLRTIEDYTVRLAKALHVIGLMNVQYAIQNGRVFVLEVN